MAGDANQNYLERTLISGREWKRRDMRLAFLMVYALVLLFAFLTLVPFIWMVFSALRPVEEIFAFPASLWPKKLSLEPLRQALERVPFSRYALNSLIQCAGVVFGQLIISAMAAYSLSKLKPKFSRAILLLIVSSLMIPFETILIPLYLQMRAFPLGSSSLWHVNLLNTYWALILPNLVSAFNIFVLKGFFDRLPDDIVYAARIDSCGEWRIFFKIIFPLSQPILVVLGIFSFISSWNSFFWPLIALNDPKIYTLMLGVQKLIENGEPWNLIMAAVTITTLPTIVIFMLLQRWIMRGIVFSGLQA